MNDKNKLCKDCYHCKVKKGKISCKEGYFNGISVKKLSTTTPYDYNCESWDGD